MDTPATLAPAPADSGADYAISGRLDIHACEKGGTEVLLEIPIRQAAQ